MMENQDPFFKWKYFSGRDEEETDVRKTTRLRKYPGLRFRVNLGDMKEESDVRLSVLPGLHNHTLLQSGPLFYRPTLDPDREGHDR